MMFSGIINFIAHCFLDYYLLPPVSPLTITLKSFVVLGILFMSYVLGDRLLSAILIISKKSKRNIGHDKQAKAPVTNKVYKNKLLIKLDNWLRKNYRPFYFNASSYLITTVVVFVFFGLIIMLMTKTLLIAIIAAIISSFTVYLVTQVNISDTNRRIDKEMPKIVNSLYMKLQAGVPFIRCLETLHERVEKSKYLRKNLMELYYRFLTNDMDIVKVCDDIENNFNNAQVSILLMAFRQYKDSNKMQDILQRQNELQQKKEEEVIDADSDMAIKRLSASAILIGLSCAVVYMYPQIVEVGKRLNEMLS